MITKPKGCYDVTGEVAKKYQRICEVVSAYAKIYNYKYIRTPLFESTELFKRGVGDTTDIVQKETYDFTGCGADGFSNCIGSGHKGADMGRRRWHWQRAGAWWSCTVWV